MCTVHQAQIMQDLSQQLYCSAATGLTRIFFSSLSNNTALTQSCSWPAFYAFPVTVTPSFDTTHTTASTCCHRSSSSTSFTITVERMSACIGSTFNTSCRTSRLRTCHHHCQHVPAPCRGFRQHVRRGQEGVVAVASWSSGVCRARRPKYTAAASSSHHRLLGRSRESSGTHSSSFTATRALLMLCMAVRWITFAPLLS